MSKSITAEDWRVLKDLCQDCYMVITNLRNKGVEGLDTSPWHSLIKRSEYEILKLQGVNK